MAQFRIQVSHGPDKHTVEIQSPQTTVAELKHTISTLTDIPTDSQKLIFKGKTLQNDSQPLCEVGVKRGSRLMVLGRKGTKEDDPSLREVDRVSSEIDGIETKMEGIREEITGIEQGFVQTELVVEACHGLHKRCLACGEYLMQKLEKLDAIVVPPTETLIRGRKKSLVIRTQALLTRNDDLIKRIDAIRQP